MFAIAIKRSRREERQRLERRLSEATAKGDGKGRFYLALPQMLLAEVLVPFFNLLLSLGRQAAENFKQPRRIKRL